MAALLRGRGALVAERWRQRRALPGRRLVGPLFASVTAGTGGGGVAAAPDTRTLSASIADGVGVVGGAGDGAVALALVGKVLP